MDVTITWYAVGEKEPPDNEPLLLVYKGEIAVGRYFAEHDDFTDEKGEESLMSGVTHWAEPRLPC